MLHLANVFPPQCISNHASIDSLEQSKSLTVLPTFSFESNCCGTSNIIGSSTVSYGDSVVSAFVHVVRPNQSRNLSFDQGYLECEVVFGPCNTGSNSASKLSTALHKSLLPAILMKNYPKSTISISVTIISSSAAFDLAASILAASIALIDAAVDMKDIPTAVAVFTESSDSIPSINFTVSCLSSLDEFSYLDFEGEMDISTILPLLQAAKNQCASIRKLITTQIAQQRFET
jgi:ribonuclease PH